MNFLELRPITNSLLACSLFGIGIIGALFILALIGRTNPPKHPNFFRWAHRITGYVFFALYVFIATIMFKKFGEFNLLPPKATIHAYIGISIFAMIIIKICIARFYRKFYSSLPIYGILIIIAVYLQLPLYAGYDIFSAIKDKYTILSGKRMLVWTQANVSQKTVQQKCTINSSQEKSGSYTKTEAIHNDISSQQSVIPGLTRNPWYFWIPVFTGMTGTPLMHDAMYRWQDQDYVSHMHAKDPKVLDDSEALPTARYFIENLGMSDRKIEV